MQAYRTSTKLKLGLIAGAVAIAVASLAFTQRLADRLEAQDESAVELWARAIEFQYRTSAAALGAQDRLDATLEALEDSDIPGSLRDSLAAALERSDGGDGLDFVVNEIVFPDRFSVPAIITDTAMTYVSAWRNVEGVREADATDADRRALLDRAAAMDALHPPIVVDEGGASPQLVHYGESPLARLIRLFPFVQLAVVGLFILVGYLGFSYVRRSEQSNLWVGMAKEAAHQLGTPLSSMIGWIELLRLGDDAPPIELVADELEQDTDRLRRVADRFEKIGSLPDLDRQRIGPVLEGVGDYMRRRLPQSGRPITLTVEAPDDLEASINAELFEWVIENLLKNAVDAMGDGGKLSVIASGSDDRVVVEVADTGKGMDRATARHVFRPGFSTKRRGWGLGLSLSKRIVEAYHGGTLEVASTRPGEGTTFRITLGAPGTRASRRS